jgi:hypothetical protein
MDLQPELSLLPRLSGTIKSYVPARMVNELQYCLRTRIAVRYDGAVSGR